MTAATSPPPADLCCAGCGYALRGLPNDGRCPECGLAVAASIQAAARPPRLADADPRRLRWTVLGAWLLVGYAAFTGLHWAGAWRQLVPGPIYQSFVYDGVFNLVAGSAYIGGGLLFLPVLEPRVRRTVEDRAGRRLLPWLYAVGAIVRWAMFVIQSAGVKWEGTSGKIAWISLWFVPALLVNAAGLLRLAALTRRLPARRLRAALLALAALSALPFIEVVRVIALGPDLQFGGSDAPLLLDLYSPVAFCRNVRLAQGYGFSLVASIRDAGEPAIEYGWAVSILVAPAACVAVGWFAVRVTRAWLAAGRAGPEVDTD